jgi:hypothetical protein
VPAFLLFFMAAAASAAPLPACVKKTKAGYDEPKTLPALLRCQERARAGKAAGEDSLELQRAEVRDYLARHPERASAGEPPAATPAPPRAADPDAGLSPTVKAQKARSRQAVAANAERLPEGDRAAYAELSEGLWTMSGDGEMGLTPDMAKEIAGYLQKQQGGVSAEMSGLLQSLTKDGAKLSHGSVRQLKKAARDAKGEGLDLGVADEGMERWLLDPETDPAPGEKGPHPGQEDAGLPLN